MNSPKVSIIVPVFNGQEYIEKCLNSILNQNFKEFEVILINDGSTDNSRKICENFTRNDNRIKFFNQTNRGISYTRQFGVDNSLGEYIQFIDCDDWIDGNLIGDLYAYAKDKDFDIIGCDFMLELTKKSKRINCQYPNSESFRKAIISNNWGVLWKLFIKRSLFKLNEVYFPEGINHGEDYIVCTKLLLSTNKISTINLCNYHYNYRDNNSLTRNANILSTLEQIKATIEIENFIFKKGYEYMFKNELNKRKLFYSKSLISDVRLIVFNQLGLKYSFSSVFYPFRMIYTNFVLLLIKMKAF